MSDKQPIIKITKINDEIVTEIPQNANKKKKPALGYQIFEEPYANIFISAKKKSGKTSVIYHIVNKCASKKTKIMAFVSTLYKDDNWKAIRDLCKKKKIEFEGYTSVSDDGADRLDMIVNQLLDDAEIEALAEDEENEVKVPLVNYGEDEIIKYDGSSKSKYLAPEYMFIFDDISQELRNKSLKTLLKHNRHFLSKIIISSQYLLDLEPEQRKQIDYFILFKGQDKKKLETIYKDGSLTVDYNDFLKIYNFAILEPYSFLYIDTNRDNFRIGFNKKIDLNK